jgi:hypothetical protein
MNSNTNNIINSKKVCTKLYVFIVVFSFLSREVYSEWNTRDYMKRDHSLLKPYQGKINFKEVFIYLIDTFSERIWHNSTKLGLYGFYYSDRQICTTNTWLTKQVWFNMELYSMYLYFIIFIINKSGCQLSSQIVWLDIKLI